MLDGIDIWANADHLAAIDRLGPLESGYFLQGVWQQEPSPQHLLVDGFGITPAGVPYYDSDGADPDDVAALWFDAKTLVFWLQN